MAEETANISENPDEDVEAAHSDFILQREVKIGELSVDLLDKKLTTVLRERMTMEAFLGKYYCVAGFCQNHITSLHFTVKHPENILYVNYDDEFQHEQNPSIGNCDVKSVFARIMRPPTIVLSGGRMTVPIDGRWEMDEQIRFKQATNFEEDCHFALFSFFKMTASEERYFKSFCDSMRNIAVDCGINKFGTYYKDVCIVDDENISRSMHHHIFNPEIKAKFFLVAFNDKQHDGACRIKYYGDVVYGVPTLFVYKQDLFTAKYSTMLDLIMQLNIYFGGGTFTLDYVNFDRNLMSSSLIMGIYKSVHKPKDKELPVKYTISVVSNEDIECSNYVASVVVTEDLSKVVEKTKDAINDRFLKYLWYTENVPMHILLYVDLKNRDDGIYREIFDEYAPYIRSMYDEVQHKIVDYPKITIITAKRRRDVGIIAEHYADLPRGTIVGQSSKIAEDHQFYLYSNMHEDDSEDTTEPNTELSNIPHPVHYHVILNEDNFDANFLEQFTFDLCFAVPDRTEAVDVPCPLYYARQAAIRALRHMKSQKDSTEEELWRQHTSSVHPSLVHSLYFLN